MLLETLIGGGILCYAAKKLVKVEVKLKPHAVAEVFGKVKESVGNAKDAVTSVTDEVRRQVVSKQVWEESRARRMAQEMYDSTVAQIFEDATEEEKETLLTLFQKYVPKEQ